MTTSDTRRRFPPCTQPFIRNADIQADAVTSLEGQVRIAPGALAIKPLMVGQDTLLSEVHRAKGLINAEHAHPDFERVATHPGVY